jgi:hypothetical protein
MTTVLTTSWLLPADEAERLATLHRYADASCLHEPVFNGVIDLAVRIFNVPIAFISLMNAHNMLYKTNHGLAQLAQQAREAAVCSLTIRHNRPFIFSDLAQESQHSQLPEAAALVIQKHGLRFYASLPLRMPDQRPIGTLCLLGYQARTLGTNELRVLEQLAELIEQTLVIREMCLATKWLGEEHWSRIQTTLTEGLWELAALVRYLLQRSGLQVPVPADVLEPISRRLAELHGHLTVHPGSLL